MATAAMVLGIVSIFINTFFVPALLAVILGIVGLTRASEMKRTTGFATGNGPAIVGIVCGGVGIFNSLLWKWLVLFIF